MEEMDEVLSADEKQDKFINYFHNVVSDDHLHVQVAYDAALLLDKTHVPLASEMCEFSVFALHGLHEESDFHGSSGHKWAIREAVHWGLTCYSLAGILPPNEFIKMAIKRAANAVQMDERAVERAMLPSADVYEDAYEHAIKNGKPTPAPHLLIANTLQTLYAYYPESASMNAIKIDP